MIILITNKWDISADFVVRSLRERGEEFLRINTEDLPFKGCSVMFPEETYYLTNGVELFENLKSVLLRRPAKPFEINEYLERYNEQVVAYCREQWHSMIEGLISIEDVLWINNPRMNDRLENKITQMKDALSAGFRIPRTCVTTDSKEAKQFCASCGGEVIAKSLCSTIIEYPEKDYFIFTNILENIESFSDEEISIAPAIYQEYLANKLDYRVTVVGDEIFSVKIVNNGNIGIREDWRTHKEDIKFVPCSLPKEIEQKCLNFVSMNGLVFGAIDFVETDDGFYFLEINPSGEWGWLQKNAGLPIGDALAGCLIKGLK